MTASSEPDTAVPESGGTPDVARHASDPSRQAADGAAAVVGPHHGDVAAGTKCRLGPLQRRPRRLGVAGPGGGALERSGPHRERI